jgi:hypothetical protein
MKIKKAMITTFAMTSSLFMKASFIKKVRREEVFSALSST